MFKVRSIQKSDLTSVNEMLRDLAKIQNLPYKGSIESLEKGYFSSDGHGLTAFVAVRHGTLIGIVTLYKRYCTFEAGLFIEIDDLYVHPEHQRLGVGCALIDSVKGLAKEQNAIGVSCTVLASNKKAQAFYAAAGAHVGKDAWLYCDWNL